jgi:S-phase kinase-associated protein 1
MDFKIKINDKTYIVNSELIKYSKYLNELTTCQGEFNSDNSDKEILLDSITNFVFEKIIDFLNYYHKEPYGEIPKPLISNNLEKYVSEWYLSFLDKLNIDQLFEIIKASNFLEIDSLLNLTCAKVASDLKGKTVEEIRETFGIENDFTQEEEEEIRNENKWCENI